MSDLPEEGAAAEKPQVARVFFALWPDAAVRGQLVQQGLKLQRLFGGKLAREESVHMTLLFLGDVAVERLPTLLTIGAAAQFEPFVLRFTQSGCWKHNKVAWVAPAHTPAALDRLVASLEAGADRERLRFDRRPFAAHITLLRKARCIPFDAGMPAVDWDVADFVLVRSELNVEGSRYTVIGRWPGGRAS